VSAGPESRSEIAKLARLLGLSDPGSLAYLEGVPAPELRAYRDAVTNLLYDDDRELLGRAADASRLLPARTLAKIGESALGPLICAHLTGLIDAERAREIADHFSIAFLARLAAEMDPRRAVEVIAQTSPKRVLEIAQALARQGEHVAMGRFVAHLDDDTLAACLDRLSDEDVLRVAFVLEGERAHERIYALLGVVRMRDAVSGAGAAGLSEEAEYLLTHLSAAQRKQLRGRAKA
jgi:hypothetical protein